MIRLLLGLLSIIGATCLYIKGETDTKLLGKSNKWFKTLIGVPPAILIAGLWLHSWVCFLLTVVSYFIALQFGYGDNNWTVKLFGKRGALIFCGALMGLASFPVLGWWALLQGLISVVTFDILDQFNAEVKEPWVALTRGLLGTCLML